MSVLARPGSRSLILGIAGGLVSGLTLRVLASLPDGTRPFLPLGVIRRRAEGAELAAR
jgi:hypothetical protein